MQISVTVVPASADERPPEATPVHIEVRDASLQDAPAVLVAAADAHVESDADGWSAHAVVEVPDDVDPRSDLTVWVRVAASGAERTASGDWITTQSHPLPAPETADDVTVTVTQI